MTSFIQRKNFFLASIPVERSSKSYGFTLIEVMVTIALVAIVTTIALPSLNTFLVKMRVDNEVTEMQRLLLIARNTAINTGKNTTVCPLSGGACSTNWQNEISVFTADETIKIKDAIKSGDKLQFTNTNAIVYAPSGRLITPTVQSSFRYRPKNYADESQKYFRQDAAK